MSDQDPERTAFFGVVPTESVPRLLELLAGDDVLSEALETYALPAGQQEVETVAARMLGRVVNHMTPAYEVALHETRPTSLIRNVASGEVVEAITKENFRAASRDFFDGKPNVGGGLANKVFSSRSDVVGLLMEYTFTYSPKYAEHKALRAGIAGRLLVSYEQGGINLRLSDNEHTLFAHICKLVAVDSSEAT